MIQHEFFYFSERLTRKLNLIRRKPLTVVSAPGGAGKSTAVKAFLDNLTCNAVWHAVGNEDLRVFLSDFALQLGIVDQELGDALESAIRQSAANGSGGGGTKVCSAAGIAAVIKKYKPERQTFYVLECVYDPDADIPDFLYQLMSHWISDFYVIIISRGSVFRDKNRFTDDRINFISEEDFLLTPGEIIDGFDKHMTSVIPEEAALIFRHTGGRLPDTAGIFSQIQKDGKTQIWKSISNETHIRADKVLPKKNAEDGSAEGEYIGTDACGILENAMLLMMRYRLSECKQTLDSLEYSPAFAGRFVNGDYEDPRLVKSRAALEVFSGHAESGIHRLENDIFRRIQNGRFNEADELSAGSLFLKLLLGDVWIRDSEYYCRFILDELKYPRGPGSFCSDEKEAVSLMSLILLRFGYLQALLAWMESLKAADRSMEVIKQFIMSLACIRLGSEDKAAECFSAAAEGFNENGAVLPIMIFYDELRPLIEREKKRGVRTEFHSAVKENLNSYRRNMRRNYIRQEAVQGVALTERQSEIAALIEQRLSNKEIARRLHISENTVKTTVKTVFQKLGVRSRRELYR